MPKYTTKNMVSAALCIALGIVLPIFFHMVGLGSVFLPMHIPVILCGFVCGWPYGLVCGIVVPILSALLTGMPPFYPYAISMMFELGTYGLLSALLYKRFNVYVSLIGAMIGGRIVSGIANTILYGVSGTSYSFAAFISASFVTALPGIIIQIILIPLLVIALQRAKLSSKPLKDKKIRT